MIKLFLLLMAILFLLKVSLVRLIWEKIEIGIKYGFVDKFYIAKYKRLMIYP